MPACIAGAVLSCPCWCLVFYVVIVFSYRLCCLSFPSCCLSFLCPVCSYVLASTLNLCFPCSFPCSITSGLFVSWGCSCLVLVFFHPFVCVIQPSLLCSVLGVFDGWQILIRVNKGLLPFTKNPLKMQLYKVAFLVVCLVLYYVSCMHDLWFLYGREVMWCVCCWLVPFTNSSTRDNIIV